MYDSMASLVSPKEGVAGMMYDSMASLVSPKDVWPGDV